jgi:hypothetical protein
MTPIPDPRAACPTRLRFVYDDSVVSIRFGRTPTFSDIASAMGHLATRRDAAPRSIDVTFLAPSAAMSEARGMHDAR